MRHRRYRPLYGCATRLVRAVLALGIAGTLGACGPGRAPAGGARAATVQAPLPAAATQVAVPPPMAHPAAQAATQQRAQAASRTVAADSVTPRPVSLPIPILMYHVVGVVPAGAPYPGLYVAPDLFAAQMAALAAAGYQAISLQQAYDIWTGRAPAPKHAVVLSFDDGYVGVYRHAVPVLQAQGWAGVLNLQVGRLNVPGGLSTDQVREMIRLGWEVDDHTVTHPDLTRVSPTQLEAEINGAALTIRQDFGVPVRFFCYPAGRYDPQVVAAVRAAGFLGATTTWPGDADPTVEGAFTLDRVRVDAGESPQRLVAVLSALGAQAPVAPPVAFPPPALRPMPAHVSAGAAAVLAVKAGATGSQSSTGAAGGAGAQAGGGGGTTAGTTAGTGGAAASAKAPTGGTAAGSGTAAGGGTRTAGGASGSGTGAGGGVALVTSGTGTSPAAAPPGASPGTPVL